MPDPLIENLRRIPEGARSVWDFLAKPWTVPPIPGLITGPQAGPIQIAPGVIPGQDNEMARRAAMAAVLGPGAGSMDRGDGLGGGGSGAANEFMQRLAAPGGPLHRGSTPDVFSSGFGPEPGAGWAPGYGGNTSDLEQRYGGGPNPWNNPNALLQALGAVPAGRRRMGVGAGVGPEEAPPPGGQLRVR